MSLAYITGILGTTINNPSVATMNNTNDTPDVPASQQWSAEDLTFLAHALYDTSNPDTVLHFQPPLNVLPLLPTPLHITLLRCTATQAAEFQSGISTMDDYNGQHLPTMLAESLKNCPSAAHARHSMAANIILGNFPVLLRRIEYYDLLAIIFSAPAWVIESLQRALAIMRMIPEHELQDREEMLMGVTERDTLEARMEKFLLCGDRTFVVQLMNVVGAVLRWDMGVRERLRGDVIRNRDFLRECAYGDRV